MKKVKALEPSVPLKAVEEFQWLLSVVEEPLKAVEE